MRVFILLLVCVYLCACSARPVNLVPTGGVSVFEVDPGQNVHADNGTCESDRCDEKGVSGQDSDDQGDTVAAKVVKTIFACVLAVALIGLTILSRVPAKGQ